jgi:hypothetical protein
MSVCLNGWSVDDVNRLGVQDSFWWWNSDALEMMGWGLRGLLLGDIHDDTMHLRGAGGRCHLAQLHMSQRLACKMHSSGRLHYCR